MMMLYDVVVVGESVAPPNVFLVFLCDDDKEEHDEAKGLEMALSRCSHLTDDGMMPKGSH